MTNTSVALPSRRGRAQAAVRRRLLRYYAASSSACRASILELVDPHDHGRVLDCGCDDGSFTRDVVARAAATDAYGIEIVESAARAATVRGVEVARGDLASGFPTRSGAFDLVVANQVIEHVADTDGFVTEIFRVLSPGGYAIVSTNNLASWHNIAALVLGRQPFPADVSTFSEIGKPFPLFEGAAGSWAHLRIFTPAALTGIFRRHGFTVDALVGIGFYPFSSRFAEALTRLDRRHAVYLTIKVRRP